MFNENVGGYTSTTIASGKKSCNVIHHGPASVNYTTYKSNPSVVAAGKTSMATLIQKELRDILNQTNAGMKLFLRNCFGVMEFHDMCKSFGDLGDFKNCFDKSMKINRDTNDQDEKLATPEEPSNDQSRNFQEHLKRHVINKVVFAENGQKEKEGSLNEKSKELPSKFLDDISNHKNQNKKRWHCFVNTVNKNICGGTASAVVGAESYCRMPIVGICCRKRR